MAWLTRPMYESSAHSISAPKNMADAHARLQLLRSRRVGPATYFRLMEEYGDAEAALDALPKIAAESGVKGYTVCPLGVIKAEFKSSTSLGFKPLFYGEAHYPTPLGETKDAPPFLWTLGDQSLFSLPMVGIVGARNASSLGMRFTRKLAKDLADLGFCVVSGLARGIDASAHEAALPYKTIGVQAGGLDVVYPKENAMLHARMATEGLRISEHPPGLEPQARHFPQRNRIVAGLSQGLIVVEGAARSGSLITARCAAELGRDVMAVPGNPMDGRATGCNYLIRDGATLIRNAEDVIELLGDPKQTLPAPPATKQPDLFTDDPTVSAKILAQLGPSGVAEDIVIRDTGLPPAIVAERITALEMDGVVERQAGGKLARMVH